MHAICFAHVIFDPTLFNFSPHFAKMAQSSIALVKGASQGSEDMYRRTRASFDLIAD